MSGELGLASVVKSRDRHARGLRGRLAWPNPYTGAAVRVRSRQEPRAFFASCVADALTQIGSACPRALAAVDIGIEDVPTIETEWAPGGVPLAAALSPTVVANGQVVLFRRPLERRAATRKGLRILVYRTIVEQLSGITGIAIDEIDPSGHRDEEGDWDD